MKKVFQYHQKNIELLTNTAYSATYVSNIITPLTMFYLTKETLSATFLYLWIFAHLVLYVIRLTATLHASSKNYLLIMFVSITFSALLYGLLVWVAMLNHIPQINLFIISMIIIIVTSGSISTIVNIFSIFVSFILSAILPLVGALFYIQEPFYNLFGIILLLFMLILLRAGHNQYSTIKELIYLKDTFETLYRKSSDGIVLHKNNRIIDCNPAILKMFQFKDKEEFLNTPLDKYMPIYQTNGKRSLKEMLKMANQALKEGHNAFEWIYKRKNGDLFWAEVVLNKIFLDGEPLIHGVYRDVTQRKYLEQEKEKLQQYLKEEVQKEVEKNRQKDKAMLEQTKLAQMGEMINMIAHQWRQPLSAISATASVIEVKAKKDKLDNASAQKLSNKISKFAQHLSRTIDDFRNFFKENKDKHITTTTILVQETLNIVQTSLQSNNITLKTLFYSKQEIETYSNEVKQVLLNIIQNAQEALLDNNIKNPYIEIETYDKDDKVYICIKDNAQGISKENLSKIFEPYFSTKSKKDGTGLGLYMSKIIINEHCKGNLSVTNSVKGASFLIELSSFSS